MAGFFTHISLSEASENTTNAGTPSVSANFLRSSLSRFISSGSSTPSELLNCVTALMSAARLERFISSVRRDLINSSPSGVISSVW